MREQGARVAHNSPHDQGPSEWLVTPPDDVLFGSDPRRDLRSHYPGVSTNVSLPQVRLLEDDRRGQELGSLGLYFWAQTIKLSLPHLRLGRTSVEEKHVLTGSNVPNFVTWFFNKS